MNPQILIDTASQLVADRKGSEQIDDWIAPVKENDTENGLPSKESRT